MPSLVRILLYISLLASPLPAGADMDISGIKLADQITLGNEPLALNGAGVRSKFFVEVYVGALYLNKTTHDARQALENTGAKSMQMVILYKEVDAEKITRGWVEGIENNLDKAAQAKIADRLSAFNALFPDLHAGDHVNMNFIPGRGTTLSINQQTLGEIEGDDFFAALLSVWLGSAPADKHLKTGLLGN
jgi:Chalcone isomerase-like